MGGNDGKPIYFDSIYNSAYILGKSPHSARKSWIYIDGETFQGVRVGVGDDPKDGTTLPTRWAAVDGFRL
jgi:arylsulfatase